MPEDPFEDLYDNDDSTPYDDDDDDDGDEEGDEDFKNKEALDRDSTVFLWWKVKGDSITYKVRYLMPNVVMGWYEKKKD